MDKTHAWRSCTPVKWRPKRASSSIHGSIPRRTLMDVQNIFGRLIFHLCCNNFYHFRIKVFWRSVRCKFQLLYSELCLFALHLFCLLVGLLLDSWVSCGVKVMQPVKQNNNNYNNKKSRPSPLPRLSIETISGLFSLGVFSICHCSLWDMKVAMCFDLNCSRRLFFLHHECHKRLKASVPQRDPQIRPVTKELPSKWKNSFFSTFLMI